MNDTFLLLYLNMVEDPYRWNMGAGIYFTGYSFDNGQTWYILFGSELIEEHELEVALFANSMLACAG